MARFLCWLIGRQPAGIPVAPVHTVSRPPCTPGRRPRRRTRRPLAGTALPRSPWNRSAGR
ncbi:hypothetical protein [Micromonospora sp. NPDC001898]|uniref:hypothetical protein n=1 Tax=Micromonospora sp. NPDC001898 TaxID=3364221 RepID=UPI0036B40F21